ncbi:MAG: S1 RNA-binding domain-containing protein, partial [Myxococcales bacterium]|nr:S1 RNA-binding domain-containing protein [Myxococcales bacterium]
TYQSWLHWRKAIVAHSDAIDCELVAALCEKTWRNCQIALLARAAAICTAETCPDAEQREAALSGCLALWNEAWELSLKRGELLCKEANPSHPKRADYSLYLNRREPLHNIPPYRFMAIRRGAEEGVIDLGTVLPKNDIKKLFKGRDWLASVPAWRDDAERASNELVLDMLPSALLEHFDNEMRTQAHDAAIQRYLELLVSSPLQTTVCGAVYVGSLNRDVGLAVVGQDKTVRLGKTLDPKEMSIDGIVEELRRFQVRQVAMPESAMASHRLATLKRGLETAGFEVIDVPTNAIVVARAPQLEADPELRSEIASAITIARRAMFPFESWAELDPIALGLAEYPQALDEEHLRAEMIEIRDFLESSLLGGDPDPRAAGMRPGIKPGNLKNLNPMVNELSDLRPGMMVDGVVTNVSDFGAFVSIGLDREALVHISELSDEFVKSPSDVVQVGQRVQARVINVDLVKKRISLSLKSGTGAPKPKSSSGGGKPSTSMPHASKKPSSNQKPANAPPGSRSAALSALENLFKK